MDRRSPGTRAMEERYCRCNAFPAGKRRYGRCALQAFPVDRAATAVGEECPASVADATAPNRSHTAKPALFPTAKGFDCPGKNPESAGPAATPRSCEW